MRRLATVAYLSTVLGCYSTTYDPYYYDTVYYDPYWYAYDAALAYTWVDPWGVTYFALSASSQAQTEPMDLETLAMGIADVANTQLLPAGCANAVATGVTVEMTLSDCDGPYGFSRVNGMITTALSESDGALVITSSSQDLEVGGAPFIIDSVATATMMGTQREVTVVSRSRNPDIVDSRDAEFTMTWTQGSGCFTLDGEATTTLGGRNTISVLDGYTRCAGECPEAGSITVSSDEGDSFAADFDGSPDFLVRLPDGETRSYTLLCE